MKLPILYTTKKTPDRLINDPILNAESRLLHLEAGKMGIKTSIIANTHFLKFEYKDTEAITFKNKTYANSPQCERICLDKNFTREFLESSQINTPKGFPIVKADTLDYRKAVFSSLKKPLAVKPAHGSWGQGVALNINSFQQMNEVVDTLFATSEQDLPYRSGSVVIEEMCFGEEYRIFSTQNSVIAVMNRQPASVIGDGTQTIKQLVELENHNPLRHISPDLYPLILFDKDMEATLKTQNFTLESIPANGQKIKLRNVSNIMAGGIAIDVTDQIHPTVTEIAINTVRAIPGAKVLGIDFMTANIQEDQYAVGYNVIEINSYPGFVMHDIPMIGKNRGVARTILKLLFPQWQE